jgi:hypothetical protein
LQCDEDTETAGETRRARFFINAYQAGHRRFTFTR